MGCFALLFTKSYITLDPDIGYRLVTGQKILSGNIPKVDPYSYTMPSFPYVEHAMTIAATWAFLYPYIGKAGLALLSATFALLALLVASSRVAQKSPAKLYKKINSPFGKNLWHFGRFTFLLAFAVMLPFTGVRAQVVSWLLLSGFLYILLTPRVWQKFKLITPLIFVFWANTHGSWAAALAMFALVTTARSISVKKILFTDFTILAVSALATLVNPYGAGVWREVWLSVSDSSIRWRIIEWMPPFLSADLGFVAFLTISVFFVWKYRRKFNLENLALYFLVLLQALLTRRHIPLWVLVALPMTTEAIGFLYQDIKSIKFGAKRFDSLYKYTWIFALTILIVRSGFAINGSLYLREGKFYPVGAVNYLQENPPDGEIFSLYGWGGYLIWRMPEQKVFIDGRMPSWRWNDAPDNETGHAFDDYMDLFKGDIDLVQTFDKYNVDTVLVSPRNEGGGGDNSLAKLQEKFDNFLTKFGKEKNNFNFYDELSQNGWEKVYKDDNSAIYRKSPKQ